jgi:hypothetical protein
MSALILVVDDELDDEDLVSAKVRRQIKDGSIVSGSPAMASRRGPRSLNNAICDNGGVAKRELEGASFRSLPGRRKTVTELS